jgi:flagellar hook-associated protein 2
MNTDAIVEKLVNVEARPIRQLEDIKKNHGQRKEALKALRNQLEDLNNAAKDLYGFRSPFSEKNATVSDPSVMEIKSGKGAEGGTKKVQVMQLATNHKISTDAVDEKETLPAGKIKIEVNGEAANISFNGGTMKNLEEKISESAQEVVTSAYVRTSGDNCIVTLESRTQGRKGEIKVSGDQALLNKIGLVGVPSTGKKNEAGLTFDRRYLSAYSGDKKPGTQSGSVSVGGDGRSLGMKGLVWQEYALPVESQLKKDSTLALDFSYTAQKSEMDDRAVPGRIETGPDDRVNIKGIELNGYNVSRIRQKSDRKKASEFDSLAGIGVVSEENGKRTEKIYGMEKDSKGRVEIPVGRDFAGKKIGRIIFYCNAGEAVFSNASFSTPLNDDNRITLKNELAKADNARVRVDGVEMERDRNNDLNDVIKGLTLTLKKTHDGEISVNIDQNLDKAVEKIKKFVDVYNKYIDLHRELVKTAKISKPGEFNNRNNGKGLFVGDMTLVNLEGNLKKTISNAYPNRAEHQIRIISQLGVSTGAVNADWEAIKAGKLVIDDALLRKTITENPEGVSMFFGSDSDGDSKVDTGMAYSLGQALRPYLTSGKNILVTKMDLEEGSIKSADERIDRQEQHLKQYEEKLKKKFRNMERAISESNSQKSWMNNQFKSAGGTDGQGANMKK